MIGLEAAKRKVKAYARVQHPFYETSSSSKSAHDEKEDAKPVGTLGIWWHETLRILAAIEEYVNIDYERAPSINSLLVLIL